MAYLSYEEYLTYGGTLDETTFDEYLFEAEAQIDWYTFGRLQNFDESTVDVRVKRCAYYLLKLIQNAQTVSVVPTADGSTNTGALAGILSQSNDGVSISYATMSAKEVLDRFDGEVRSAIQKYLQAVKDQLGRKVLYRGIYPGE